MKHLLTPERLAALEALLGLSLLVYGVSLLHVPSAFIVAGGALFLSAVVPRRG